jgi:hypothetical protein
VVHGTGEGLASATITVVAMLRALLRVGLVALAVTVLLLIVVRGGAAAHTAAAIATSTLTGVASGGLIRSNIHASIFFCSAWAVIWIRRVSAVGGFVQGKAWFDLRLIGR